MPSRHEARCLAAAVLSEALNINFPRSLALLSAAASTRRVEV
jgi:hypothetical protein